MFTSSSLSFLLILDFFACPLSAPFFFLTNPTKEGTRPNEVEALETWLELDEVPSRPVLISEKHKMKVLQRN